MNLIIGIVVVFTCVFGGFAIHGGQLGALWQPNELLIIGGAAIGALIIANPFSVTKRVLGSARLEPFSRDILVELAHIINEVPNRISISGHTDIKPYVAPNYSNWELSADRANAARRALIGGDLPPEKIGRVVGLASSVLLDATVPDSPVNRRISIVVMNKRTDAAISQENGNLLSVQHAQQVPGDQGAVTSREVTSEQ